MMLIRVLIRTAGTPAFRRAAPVYVALALVGAVIFGKNAMRPADVAAAAADSWRFALVLWSLWLLAMAPAAHTLFRGPDLDYLRWLPAGRGHIYATLTVLLMMLHVPWMALWALGQGLMGAASALFLATAVHALVSVRARSRVELGAGLVVLAGAMAAVTMPAPGIVVLIASAAVVCMAVPAAWARAPEQHTGRSTRRMATHPVLALAQTYVSGLVRTHPAVLVRGVIITSLGAGLTILLGRANELSAADVAVYSSFVAALSLAMATAGTAAPLAELEHALGWILGSAGTSHDVRASARSLAAGAAGLTMGMVHGVLVVWGLGLGELGGAARIMGGAVALGISMALIGRRSARWVERSPHVRASADSGVDGSRVVSMMALATIATMVAIVVLDDAAVLAVLGFSVAISWGRA